jgi:diguanylate cyclase (GGDEF)-like protein
MDIFAILILGLLTFLTFIWLERNMGKSRRKKEITRARLHADYERKTLQSRVVQDEHVVLCREFEETIALYDITREITKYLDEEKVFSAFREQLATYIRFADCRYFKDVPEPGYDRSLALKLGETVVGYLACRGVENRDAEKFQIMAGQFILGIKRAILYKKVQEMATYDSLTGVYTRRYWFERSRQEIERSQRFGYKACCLMADVDRFKDFNDRYGHLVGDAILVEVSKIIRETIRQIDLLGKYGGEEFCLLLTETDMENAVYAAERIRQAIAQRLIHVYDEDLSVTISIGVSVFPAGGTGLEELIDAADRALYQAKQQGRNRVCTAASS